MARSEKVPWQRDDVLTVSDAYKRAELVEEEDEGYEGEEGVSRDFLESRRERRDEIPRREEV